MSLLLTPCNVTLKDNNTTGSLYLFHLFYVFSMIMLSDYVVCKRVHFYTFVICTDGAGLNT